MLAVETRSLAGSPSAAPASYTVTGYASTFDTYTLFTDESGTAYKERILPTAFNNADMLDVIFLYDHTGHVLARQKNHTLILQPDAHGLRCVADLSKSQRAREMYSAIKQGLIYKMSFSFIVGKDEYDRINHTRIIRSIKRIIDVSAVAQPANPFTGISARSAPYSAAEAAHRAEALKQLKLLLEVSNHV